MTVKGLTVSVLVAGALVVFLLPPIFSRGEVDCRNLLLSIAAAYLLGVSLCTCFLLAISRRKD